MESTLDAIVTNAQSEPVELPRLTTANVFTHYARLGSALERAADAFKKIPDATDRSLTDELKELMKACDVAIKTAARLLEANR